jgi:hypothetical protein
MFPRPNGYISWFSFVSTMVISPYALHVVLPNFSCFSEDNWGYSDVLLAASNTCMSAFVLAVAGGGIFMIANEFDIVFQ